MVGIVIVDQLRSFELIVVILWLELEIFQHHFQLIRSESDDLNQFQAVI